VGLSLLIGAPEGVFSGDLRFASTVRAALELRYGTDAAGIGTGKPSSSDELGWGWWRELQALAEEVVDEARVPNLLAMPAWYGVYVPVRAEVASLAFEGHPTNLDVASLPGLAEELMHFGQIMGRPTDPVGLTELARYYDHPDRHDSDPAIQMYATCCSLRKERSLFASRCGS
jgi:hypothetical protein